MNNELENNLKKKTGNTLPFSIPENYMDGIEDDFFMKIKEQPFPKTTSFTTPDRYFENLEDEILNKTNTSFKKGKLIHFNSTLIKLLPTTIAACLLVFVGLQFFNTPSTEVSFDAISNDDIEAWFEENNSYTDTEIAFTFDEAIDENELTLTAVNLNNDALEDYFNTIEHIDLLD